MSSGEESRVNILLSVSHKDTTPLTVTVLLESHLAEPFSAEQEVLRAKVTDLHVTSVSCSTARHLYCKIKPALRR